MTLGLLYVLSTSAWGAYADLSNRASISPGRGGKPHCRALIIIGKV